MKIPEIPQRGQAVDASWAADVVRYLKALTPRPSATVKPSMGSGGTTFRSSVPQAARKTPPGVFPWQPLSDDGAGNVVFKPGFLNDRTPKIGSTAMDDSPAPTLGITTNGTVYLRVEHADGVVDSSTAELFNAASTPASDASYLYITIHHVRRSTEESGAITLTWTVSRTTHLWAAICDGELRVRRA